MQWESRPAGLHLENLPSTAQRIETPCGEGTMLWHIWGHGPDMVLLHGGAGSWRHWARNIVPLARNHRLIVADLPGLGDSAMPPEPITTPSVAAIVAQGIDRILGTEARYTLVGFSYGGVAGAEIALMHATRLRSFTIIASGGLDLPTSKRQLLRVRGLQGEERRAAQIHNLSQQMIADVSKIDDLAIEIQEWNTRHSRLNTPELSRSRSLQAALPKLTIRLNAIYGDRDSIAYPHLAERESLFKRLQPLVDFRFIAGAGHWVPYEAYESFNALLLELIDQAAG